MTALMFRTCVVLAIALGAIAITSPAFAAGTTTTTVPRSKALAAYRSCMSAHGVKLPTNPRPPGSANNTPSTTGPSNATGSRRGGFGSGTFVPRNLPKGVTVKKYEAAQKACAGKLPAGGFGRFGQQNSAQFQAYLSCLGDHGVKVPTNGSLRGLNRDDPTFQAANQICGVLLPARPGAGAGGSTPTTGATST
jgi:hypothetical protein